MLYREYLAHFGHLAPNKALDSVDEIELRERASLAGPEHLDADGAVLLVAGYDPGVSPVGPQRRTDLVQRVLHSFVHVPLLLHLAADYIRLWGRISSSAVVEWGAGPVLGKDVYEQRRRAEPAGHRGAGARCRRLPSLGVPRARRRDLPPRSGQQVPGRLVFGVRAGRKGSSRRGATLLREAEYHRSRPRAEERRQGLRRRGGEPPRRARRHELPPRCTGGLRRRLRRRAARSWNHPHA